MSSKWRAARDIVTSEGVEIVELDAGDGKGGHGKLVLRYRGVAFKVKCSPNKDHTDRHTANFRADIRRIKRRIDQGQPLEWQNHTKCSA